MIGRDETGDSQVVSPKNTGKGKNPRLAPFGAKEGFNNFVWISWLGTARETGSTQALSSWTPVTLPAAASGR